jgi:hypothetical protein
VVICVRAQGNGTSMFKTRKLRVQLKEVNRLRYPVLKGSNASEEAMKCSSICNCELA